MTEISGNTHVHSGAELGQPQTRQSIDIRPDEGQAPATRCEILDIVLRT
jgi:hypothetical protein